MRLLNYLLPVFLFIAAGIIHAQPYQSENLFYYVDRPASFEAFKENAHLVSIVGPQSYKISADGAIYGSIDPRVLKIARENDVKVMPLFVNSGEKSFDNELLKEVLANPQARARSITMMVTLARKHDFYGWQFDVENVHIEDREAFTEWYTEAAEALHKEGFALSAAVVHQFSDFPGPNAYHNFLYEQWRAGYDFVKLAEVSDFLSIMTYSQHTRRTPPGPVASYNWTAAVADYLLGLGVPPEKLSLGLPSYSYYWYPDYTAEKGGFMAASSLTHAAAVGKAKRYDAELRWDEEATCHYAVYSNGGVYEYIFIEDAKSFEQKLDIMINRNLRGFSVWVLGSEDPAVWKVVKDKLERR